MMALCFLGRKHFRFVQHVVLVVVVSNLFAERLGPRGRFLRRAHRPVAAFRSGNEIAVLVMNDFFTKVSFPLNAERTAGFIQQLRVQ